MMHAQHVPMTEFPRATFYLSATRGNFESCTSTGDVNRFARVFNFSKMASGDFKHTTDMKEIFI